MEAFLLRVLFLMCCILLVPSHAMKRTCVDYKEWGLPSGVYVTDLDDGLLPFLVYCDMDTFRGGWTVFQRRINGSVDFYRNWQDYAQGFGDLQGEFWLGNDHLHRLTKSGLNDMRVDLGDWEGKKAHMQFNTFKVGPASDNYRLNMSYLMLPFGDAGDSLTQHNGLQFTTKDADHDLSQDFNCAVMGNGAWWYHNCFSSNLNGKYYHDMENPTPHLGWVVWEKWRWFQYSLKYTDMKLRERVPT